MKTITWLPLAGYEGLYIISNEGKIKSTERIIINSKGKKYRLKERPMSITIDKRSGYHVVKLTKRTKYGTQYLHRLMANTFIPNPENKPIVKHLNGNKKDCRIENLKWVTRSENHLYAITTLPSYVPSYNKRKAMHIFLEKILENITSAVRFIKLNYNTPRI